MDGYEDTDLWKTFYARASDEQRTTVRRLLDHAVAKLDRVIETFPTYTLHNHVHAENVVRLMGEVLGPSALERITPLEGAMLLLSAYWHDIGMVFDADERAALRSEDAFPRFLDEHPKAFVAVKERPDADELPLDIAEWYCRWRHADRVFVHLDQLPDDWLVWDGIPLRDHLGKLCRSHNYGSDEVQGLPTAFAAECDLRFCAVVLRLADILDFDRSRSPAAVYGHLGLARRRDRRAEASDVEWRKHLASKGFQFPADRPAPYTVELVAGPDSPSVEHDLRAFLDIIEGEMASCAALASTCSAGWRDVPLPGRVGRGSIVSNGYKYGEHRFTLDREQVLQLFMGENLYENPFTFVRELLQNAIDAARHREFFERSRGDVDFTAPPIKVDDWTDRDGYRWVRFDDSGMGMTEEIILDYFLKVGRSYYQSATFKAELLRYAERGTDFQPISRFGIGILSCFIVGDRVEVSTRRIDAPPPHRRAPAASTRPPSASR
jgi:hypothetical protein